MFSINRVQDPQVINFNLFHLNQNFCMWFSLSRDSIVMGPIMMGCKIVGSHIEPLSPAVLIVNWKLSSFARPFHCVITPCRLKGIKFGCVCAWGCDRWWIFFLWVLVRVVDNYFWLRWSSVVHQLVVAKIDLGFIVILANCEF